MAAANSGSVGRGKPFVADYARPTRDVVVRGTQPPTLALTHKPSSVKKARYRVEPLSR